MVEGAVFHGVLGGYDVVAEVAGQPLFVNLFVVDVRGNAVADDYEAVETQAHGDAGFVVFVGEDGRQPTGLSGVQ